MGTVGVRLMLIVTHIQVHAGDLTIPHASFSPALLCEKRYIPKVHDCAHLGMQANVFYA
jgi:hypothetical protein